MRGFQIKSYVGKKKGKKEIQSTYHPSTSINITSSKISRFFTRKKRTQRGSEVKQTENISEASLLKRVCTFGV